jgi:hypothetical protein
MVTITKRYPWCGIKSQHSMDSGYANYVAIMKSHGYDKQPWG